MLPLQDHGKCMKVEQREFKKLQLLKVLEHSEPALNFIFAWGQAKFLILEILITAKYELFFIIKISLKLLAVIHA